MTHTHVHVLEIFAEAAQVPSHTRERRHYQRALRARDRYMAEKERYRLIYHADKFLRRRLPTGERLPAVCACVACGLHFGHVQGLLSHLRYWRGACASAAAQAAE